MSLETEPKPESKFEQRRREISILIESLEKEGFIVIPYILTAEDTEETLGQLGETIINLTELLKIIKQIREEIKIQTISGSDQQISIPKELMHDYIFAPKVKAELQGNIGQIENRIALTVFRNAATAFRQYLYSRGEKGTGDKE